MTQLERLVDDLKSAARDDDPDRLDKACDALIGQMQREPDTIDAKQARATLKALRSCRRYAHMMRMAEAFISDGCEDAQVQRQYAQALIEHHQTTPAIHMLEEVIARKSTSDEERADAKGVLGRAWKERALMTRGKRDDVARAALKKAYHSYMDVYSENPEMLFQGINAVALEAWDRGFALKPKERKAARQAAQKIVEHVENMAEGSRSAWDLATAGEAEIALGRQDKAAGWFRDYAQRADAFSLAGTVRQLTELWKLDETEEGRNLLGPLRAHLLEKPGGSFAVSAKEMKQMAAVSQASYEKVLGNIGPMTFTWMQGALKNAESVALIRQNGRGIGTGFVVRGSDLNADLSDELYILTNAHVVSDPPIGDAAHPTEATVTFELGDGRSGTEYRIEKVVWQSPPDAHDASLLKLNADLRGKFEPLTVTPDLPFLNPDRPQRVYIIGHPGGGEISFSFQDNELLDYETDLIDRSDDPSPCRIHYHTPTEPGSSGSPVFNSNWAAIALHHSGSKHMPRLNGKTGNYAANEGIWIQSIIRARPGPVA